MFELTVITRFAAAHQLKMVAQKCENLHGHNWKVEVRVTGEKLDQGGILAYSESPMDYQKVYIIELEPTGSVETGN